MNISQNILRPISFAASPKSNPPSKKEELVATIRDNIDFIDKGGVRNPESPEKWKEAVEAAKTFLVQPGTQGENPGEELYVSGGDKNQVSFLTMHQVAFTRVRPYPSSFSFVQWPGQESPHLQQRTGEDNFPVYQAEMADQDTAVTLGTAPGSWHADRLVTVYNQDSDGWDGDSSSLDVPELSDRGVTEHAAGGLRFDRQMWNVQMSRDSDLPTVELREKFRDESGRLTTPEEPSAFLKWESGALRWESAQ